MTDLNILVHKQDITLKKKRFTNLSIYCYPSITDRENLLCKITRNFHIKSIVCRKKRIWETTQFSIDFSQTGVLIDQAADFILAVA